MYLVVSLLLGLLYVSSFHPSSAAEYQPQFELLTKQHAINPHETPFPRLDQVTIDQLHRLFDDRSLTSEYLVQACFFQLICKGTY